MVKVVIESVRNPVWSSEDGSTIECLLRSNILVDEISFTASRDDPEPHGREVFERCLAGEFGEIGPLQRRTDGAPLASMESAQRNQQIARFLVETNRENARKSYRSVVIVWASLIENLLDQMLEADITRSTTQNGGERKPPSTFAARIERALERRLIDQAEADRCQHISKLRDEAAHDWELTLESPGVLASLSALHAADHAGVLVFHDDLDFLIRLVYSRSCATLSMTFWGRLQISPRP